MFGAPLGEHHTLAIAVVADLVRLEGFSCLELGADVPPGAFASAAAGPLAWWPSASVSLQRAPSRR